MISGRLSMSEMSLWAVPTVKESIEGNQWRVTFLKTFIRFGCVFKYFNSKIRPWVRKILFLALKFLTKSVSEPQIGYSEVFPSIIPCTKGFCLTKNTKILVQKCSFFAKFSKFLLLKNRKIFLSQKTARLERRR